MIIEAPATYTLSSFEPLRIEEPDITITEDMVDAQLAREMARFAYYEDAPDGAQENQYLRVNMHVAINGEPQADLSGENLTVLLSRDLEPSGFVDNVIGMQTHETRAFSFTAQDQENPTATPDTFDVSLELLEKRQRCVPELTDEFVQTHLSQHDTTIQQFRDRIRAYLTNEQRKNTLQRREQLAIAELGKRLNQAIPDDLIEQTRDEIIASLQETLAHDKMTLVQFMQQQGMTEQQFQMTITMQARESLRQGFALDALYRHLAIPLNDDVRERALSELMPGEEDDLRAKCDENNAWDFVDTMAKRLIARDWLMETTQFYTEG